MELQLTPLVLVVLKRRHNDTFELLMDKARCVSYPTQLNMVLYAL